MESKQPKCPWCGHEQTDIKPSISDNFMTVMCESCNLGFIVPLLIPEPPEDGGPPIP